MKTYICSFERPEKLEDDLFNDDILLNTRLIEYLKELPEVPIYVDRNISIFEDYYLANYYEDELTKVDKDEA